MDTIEYSLANESLFKDIAYLRWALCTEEESRSSSQSQAEFVDCCTKALRMRSRNGDTFHWVARHSEAVIAVMTIIAIFQLPSPERPEGQWAYLTNCYVMPEHRNSGIGTKLLGKVKDWCVQQDFEVVIVWPSDRAFSFYDRAGFLRNRDPLSFTPTPYDENS